MINYNEFMRRYSNKIVGKFDPIDFDNLLGHVSENINNTIEYYGFSQIDVNKCIEGVALYLLQSYSCNEILENGYEELIENAVIKFKERFYDRTISKAESKFKNIPIKIQKQSNKFICIDHIKSVIAEVGNIFDKLTDMDTLSNEIYDMLINQGLKEEDILKEKCDFKIITCIRDRERYGSVVFNQEFNMLRNKVSKSTSDIFKRNQEELNKSYMRNEENIYTNISCMHDVAFRASVVLHTMGYTHDNIDYSKLNNFVQRDTTRLMIEHSSVINQDKKDNIMAKSNYKEAYEKELKNEEERKKRKKRIIIGVIAAVFVLDNLAYKAIQSFKDDEPKKDSKSEYEYSVNNAQGSGYMSYDSSDNVVSIAEYYNQRHK